MTHCFFIWWRLYSLLPSFLLSVMELFGAFIFLPFSIYLIPILFQETAAAADQYSGARPIDWWKLHASWC